MLMAETAGRPSTHRLCEDGRMDIEDLRLEVPLADQLAWITEKCVSAGRGGRGSPARFRRR
jgi:hypothetical protein